MRGKVNGCRAGNEVWRRVQPDASYAPSWPPRTASTQHTWHIQQHRRPAGPVVVEADVQRVGHLQQGTGRQAAIARLQGIALCCSHDRVASLAQSRPNQPRCTICPKLFTGAPPNLGAVATQQELQAGRGQQTGRHRAGADGEPTWMDSGRCALMCGRASATMASSEATPSGYSTMNAVYLSHSSTYGCMPSSCSKEVRVWV